VFDFDLLSGNDIMATETLEIGDMIAGSPPQSSMLPLELGDRDVCT